MCIAILICSFTLDDISNEFGECDVMTTVFTMTCCVFSLGYDNMLSNVGEMETEYLIHITRIQALEWISDDEKLSVG